MYRYLITILFLFNTIAITKAQRSGTEFGENHFHDLGHPFITNYTADIYGGFKQNWGAAQDSLGILYFANGDGVIVYDGKHWNTVTLPNLSHVKSITVDANNRVYAGATGELGYLEPDKTGRLVYFSLIDKLDSIHRQFSTVWECLATPSGVYFNTSTKLYRWYNGKFKIWDLPNHNRLFFINNTLYTLDRGKGILFLNENDEWEFLSGSDQFYGLSITVLLPYGENDLLVGTYDQGLFLFAEGKRIEFRTEIDDFFLQNKLYAGVQLSNNDYAFGTLTNGLVILDDSGGYKFHLEGPEPLNSEIVHHLFVDNFGTLWASLNDGISKIEHPSVFTIFDKNLGISSYVNLILRYNNDLLVGSNTGLLHLINEGPMRNPRFEVYHEFDDMIWDLLVFEGKLLVADRDGVYEIHNNKKSQINNWQPSAFFHSRIDRNRVFVSLSDGLGVLKYQNNRWESEKIFDDVVGGTYTIIEMNNGNIWLETSENWVWRINFENRDQAANLNPSSIEKLGEEQGLPGQIGNIFYFNDRVYFTGREADTTYEFDPKNKIFKVSNSLAQLLGIDAWFLVENIDNQSNIWFATRDHGNLQHWVALNHGNEEFEIVKLDHQRIMHHLGGSGVNFVERDQNLLWITGNNSIIRQDLNTKHSLGHLNYFTVINKVIYNNDSTLIGGNNYSVNSQIPYKRNSIRIQYASTFPLDETKNQFQYYLEGYDEDWSAWSEETQKDYTNLSEGDYVFHVRAKNIYNQISQESAYDFEILSPWFRTWWAYFIYALSTIGLIWMIIRWRSSRLMEEKEHLENVIKDRTHQLEVQADKLKELDRIKSRFFTNISHEFRTPITLIKGPINDLLKKNEEYLPLKKAAMVYRNANRLQRLVNQLLELSKIETGKLQLNLSKGDIYRFLRIICASFESHALERKMIFNIQIPENQLLANFDHDKLEIVVYNILSNAFKYTPDQGTIQFKSVVENEALKIDVIDNGVGIQEVDLPKIFERFYQSESQVITEEGGTGIGLALVKELTTLMNGNIEVFSKLNEGSHFALSLQLDTLTNLNKSQDFLYPEDLISSGENAAWKSASNLPGQVEESTPLVLIIEDNKDMRAHIAENLNTQFRIMEAPNGRAGLELAIEEIPDLVITDLMMPEMNGMEVCKSLKEDERTSHIPVIMLTAKALPENKIAGLETGADDYLIKPFDSRELLIRADNLIRQREKLRRRFSQQISVEPTNITVSPKEERFLSKVTEYIEIHIDDESFGVPELQEKLFLSKNQLHRKMKALTNQAPGEFIRNFRLKRAAQIISQRGDNISNVAYSVGFTNLSYFAKCFKELFGVTPSEYEKKSSVN